METFDTLKQVFLFVKHTVIKKNSRFHIFDPLIGQQFVFVLNSSSSERHSVEFFIYMLAYYIVFVYPLMFKEITENVFVKISF